MEIKQQEDTSTLFRVGNETSETVSLICPEGTICRSLQMRRGFQRRMRCCVPRALQHAACQEEVFWVCFHLLVSAINRTGWAHMLIPSPLSGPCLPRLCPWARSPCPPLHLRWSWNLLPPHEPDWHHAVVQHSSWMWVEIPYVGRFIWQLIHWDTVLQKPVRQV